MVKMSNFMKHVMVMSAFVDLIHIMMTCSIVSEIFNTYSYWDIAMCCIAPVMTILVGLLIVVIIFCKEDGYCPVWVATAPYVLEAVALAVTVGVAGNNFDWLEMLEVFGIGIMHGFGALAVKVFLSMFIIGFDE